MALVFRFTWEGLVEALEKWASWRRTAKAPEHSHSVSKLIDRQANTRREVYDQHKQERSALQRQMRGAAAGRAKEREEAEEKIRASFAPAYAVRTMSQQFRQNAAPEKATEAKKDRPRWKTRGIERDRER